MTSGFFNYAYIRPWWFRFLLLALFGSPLFGFGSLPSKVGLETIHQDLAIWCAYAVFIWLIIYLAVGIDRFVTWLCVGVIFGLTVLITGTLMRRAKIWEFVEGFAAAVSSQDLSTVTTSEANLVLRMIITMISIPYMFLAIECFPASQILNQLSRPSHTKYKEIWLGTAIFLRVFQHVFEVAGRMIIAWREENPNLVIPRHRNNWKNLSKYTGIFSWIRTSVWVWSVTLIEQSLLFVPGAVRDWNRIANFPINNKRKVIQNEHR